jgi:hypothetical protein
MSPPPPATFTHVQASTQPPAKKRADAERARDRDAEMRRAELARREEEQMEGGWSGTRASLTAEQRYKALLLINAHPASQRRAQRAALHLDGYYSYIYQGLENPPKLNLLAVLRWKHKTEAQKQAREKWVREHADSGHLASPLLWPGGRSGPNSPASEAMRSLSPRLLGSPHPLPPRSVASATSKPEQRAGRDWQYTLDDIQGYNESGGRVDFWIPPNLAPEPVERERAQSLSLQSEAQLSVPSEVAESTAGKDKDTSLIATRLASPSTPSLTHGADIVDDGSAAGDVSRRPSLEAGPGTMGHRRRLPRHRSHQSTSGIPQPSRPIQTLRALGTGVKRNLAMAMNSGPVMTDNEDERRGANAPGWTPNDSPNSPHHQVSAHSLRDNRGILGLRRSHERHDKGDWVVTSDDEPHHMRRLKLPRRAPRGFDRASRRVVTANEGMGPSMSRDEQLHNLGEALARESAPVAKATRAELELHEEEERRVFESQVYAVHQKCVSIADITNLRQLLDAQKQLVQVEKAGADMENALTHFLSQLDGVSGVFRTGADVEVRFEGLENLSRPERRASDDETADQLSPLAVESDAYFSDRNKWGSPLSPRPRPMRRQSSTALSSALPPFAYGMQAWPKRSTLDPILGVMVNPFRRVELSCQKAEATVRDMEEERASATRKIQEMVATVAGYIAQKNAVLSWAKLANDKIVEAKRQRGAKSQQVRGGLLDSVLVLPGFDTVSDILVRVFLGVLSYGLRFHRTGRKALGRGYLAWSLVISFIVMCVAFYYAGGNSELPDAPDLPQATILPITATA